MRRSTCALLTEMAVPLNMLNKHHDILLQIHFTLLLFICDRPSLADANNCYLYRMFTPHFSVRCTFRGPQQYWRRQSSGPAAAKFHASCTKFPQLLPGYPAQHSRSAWDRQLIAHTCRQLFNLILTPTSSGGGGNALAPVNPKNCDSHEA
jgi:hypothetical protein